MYLREDLFTSNRIHQHFATFRRLIRSTSGSSYFGPVHSSGIRVNQRWLLLRFFCMWSNPHDSSPSQQRQRRLRELRHAALTQGEGLFSARAREKVNEPLLKSTVAHERPRSLCTKKTQEVSRSIPEDEENCSNQARKMWKCHYSCPAGGNFSYRALQMASRLACSSSKATPLPPFPE